MIVPGAHYAPVFYEAALQSRPLSSIHTVVVHCTELPDLATAREYGEQIHYEETQTGNCGHLYIDRNGDVIQFATLDRVAHHVRGHNLSSIGIELVNEGRFPNWYDSLAQTPSEPYPDEQITSLVEVLDSLTRALPGLSTIAGHEDLDLEIVAASDNPQIQVRRKIDPGPLFPWSHVTERLPNLTRFSAAAQKPRQ